MEFEGGLRRPRGWKIGEDVFTTNPRLRQSANDHMVVRCWSAWRTHGVLPETGGVLDQAALLMDALTFLEHVYQGEIRPLERAER